MTTFPQNPFGNNAAPAAPVVPPVANGFSNGPGGTALQTTGQPAVPPVLPTTAHGSGHFDPNSIVDFLSSQGLAHSRNDLAKLFEQQGLGTAAQYLAFGSKNGAANMALLSKLKGFKGTTDKNSISGSSSIQMDKTKGNVMGKAGEFVAPPQPQQQQPQTPPVQPPGPTDYTDPTVASFDASAKAAADTATQQANTQISSLTTQHADQMGELQKEKASAIASAEAAYARANPYGSGSDKEEFISSIAGKYDQSIKEAQNSFNTQVQGVRDTLTQNLNTVKAETQAAKLNYQTKLNTDFKDYLAGLKTGDGTIPDTNEILDAIQTAMGAGKTFAQAKSEIQGALGYAQRVQHKADLQEQHQQFMEHHLANMEALTQQRLDQAETTSDKNQAKYAQDYLTKLRSSFSGTRTGDIGIGNLRISNAIKAQQVINDNTDPATGKINLSKAQYGDLVIAVASLLSSTGNPTNLQENSLTQTSLGSKGKDVYNFLTGKTDNVPSQKVIKNLISILKSNAVAAEQTRNTAIGNAFSLANPYLDPQLKDQIDSGFNFNSFEQFLKTGNPSQNWVTGQPAESNSSSDNSSGDDSLLGYFN